MMAQSSCCREYSDPSYIKLCNLHLYMANVRVLLGSLIENLLEFLDGAEEGINSYGISMGYNAIWRGFNSEVHINLGR